MIQFKCITLYLLRWMLFIKIFLNIHLAIDGMYHSWSRDLEMELKISPKNSLHVASTPAAYPPSVVLLIVIVYFTIVNCICMVSWIQISLWKERGSHVYNSRVRKSNNCIMLLVRYLCSSVYNKDSYQHVKWFHWGILVPRNGI